MAEPAIKAENDTVFFITSNQSKLEPNIKYLVKSKFAANLKCLLLKEEMYKRENFKIHIFSFEIIKDEFKEKKDPQTKAYKAIVTLKHKNDNFEGILYLKEKRKSLTNFIYDFYTSLN